MTSNKQFNQINRTIGYPNSTLPQYSNMSLPYTKPSPITADKNASHKHIPPTLASPGHHVHIGHTSRTGQPHVRNRGICRPRIVRRLCSTFCLTESLE